MANGNLADANGRSKIKIMITIKITGEKELSPFGSLLSFDYPVISKQ